MRTFMAALIRDDRGQDMIEYALLTATIGLAGVAAWTAVRSAIGTTYGSFNSSVWNLWESPNPQP